MNKSDKIREYFRKYPSADVAKVAAKFQAPKPMTYKLRKQVIDSTQLVTAQVQGWRCADAGYQTTARGPRPTAQQDVR